MNKPMLSTVHHFCFRLIVLTYFSQFFWVYEPDDPNKDFAVDSFGYNNSKFCRMERKPMLSYECCQHFAPWGLTEPDEIELF